MNWADTSQGFSIMIDPLLKLRIRKRTCLKCQEKFDSVSPANRICKGCSEKARGMNKYSKNPMKDMHRGGVRDE